MTSPVLPRQWFTEKVFIALIVTTPVLAGVMMPLILLRVEKVHTLVNSRATTQDSTIQALHETIEHNNLTITSLIQTTQEVRAAMDTLRQVSSRRTP